MVPYISSPCGQVGVQPLLGSINKKTAFQMGIVVWEGKGVCVMILLWGLSEVPNSVSNTYISNTLSHLNPKIPEAGQFALQRGSAAELLLSPGLTGTGSLDFAQYMGGSSLLKGKTCCIQNPKRLAKNDA